MEAGWYDWLVLEDSLPRDIYRERGWVEDVTQLGAGWGGRKRRKVHTSEEEQGEAEERRRERETRRQKGKLTRELGDERKREFGQGSERRGTSKRVRK